MPGGWTYAATQGPPCELADRWLLKVALLQQEPTGLWIVARIRQFPPQGVRESIVDVEEKRDVEGVTNFLPCDTRLDDSAHVGRADLLVTKREGFQKSKYRTQLLVDGGVTIIVDNELRPSVTERCLRDRGVSVSSKNALIESRNECGKELTLTDAPRRSTSHHLLGELGEWLPEKFLAIEERSYDTRRVPHHQPHDREDRSLAQAVAAMDLLQSHASFSALSPACNL